MSWGSPSGIIQSPLKFSTPSPKFSERVTSPLATSSIATAAAAAMVMSPSRGVGIGSTWSAALDEQLNKPANENISSQKLASKDFSKEKASGSHASKADSSRSPGHAKPAKIVIDREILSPELVKLDELCRFILLMRL